VLLHYLAKRKTQKLLFFACCINALPEFNQSLLNFFSHLKSQLIFMLLYDSLNLVINAFSSGLLGGVVQEKGVESTAAVGLCCMHKAPVHCILGFLFRKVMQLSTK